MTLDSSWLVQGDMVMLAMFDTMLAMFDTMFKIFKHG